MDKYAFMQACRGGAAKMDAALRAIYRDYRQVLVYEGYRALGDAELAGDLLQDTLIKAWLACTSFRGESEIFPWLKTIFRRNLVDLLRRRHPEQPLPRGDELDAEVEETLSSWRGMVDPTPEQALMAQQSEACFRACRERFSADHPLAATVIGWVVDDGLQNDEIAALLQRSPGATREYLSQCRKKARIYYADWYALTLGAARGAKVRSDAQVATRF